MTVHPKFYLFDAGVYRTIRPAGPLDSPEEIDGAALETLVYQELRAAIPYRSLKLELFFWRTAAGVEVDFVAYGGDGLFAIEVKRSRTVRRADLRGLKQFKSDYPMARCLLLFGGDRREYRDGIELLPVADALGDPTAVLAAPHETTLHREPAQRLAIEPLLRADSTAELEVLPYTRPATARSSTSGSCYSRIGISGMP